MRAVWRYAFSRRSAAVSGADAPEVSRFPCMKFLGARELFDCAEPSGDSRLSPPSILPSLFVTSWALRSYSFAAQSPGSPMPLSTLRWLPRGSPRKTRGQDGSLLLSCETLSFSTPCRFLTGAQRSQLSGWAVENCPTRAQDSTLSRRRRQWFCASDRCARRLAGKTGLDRAGRLDRRRGQRKTVVRAGRLGPVAQPERVQWGSWVPVRISSEGVPRD